MNHYVYCITEKTSNRKYIGVRSCDCMPEEDLGIHYFSSSCDEEFIDKQKKDSSGYVS